MKREILIAYQDYRDQINSYIYRLTGRWEDAEDITHQTFFFTA